MKNRILIALFFLSAVSFSQSDSLKKKLHDPTVFPHLKIKGLLTEIDSVSQKTLDIIYAYMIENPTAIVSITSLFEHEMDITPFWRRSKAVCNRLIEMGIPQERLIIKIAMYSEQENVAIQNRKMGNVIFAVESFDYVPKE